MNRNIIPLVTIIIGLIVAIVALLYFTQGRKDVMRVAVADETIVSNLVNLEFTFPSGEEAFALVEPPLEEGVLQKAYLLIPAKDYVEFSNSPDGREAPASIAIFVFDKEDSENPDEVDTLTELKNWAADNSSFTSINLAKEPVQETVLDGAPTIFYKADGLYQQLIYLSTYRGRIYMFVSQYDSERELTFAAFPEFLKKVVFL